MSEENTYVQTLRRLAVQQQGIIEAADVLERIGVVKDHIAELERHRDRALEKNAKIEEELTTAAQAVLDAQAQADQIVVKAHADAQRIEEAAHASVRSIMLQSDLDLAAKEAKAHDDLHAELALVQADIDEARINYEAARESMEVANHERVLTEEARALASAQLDSVKAEIAKLPKF